MPAFSPHTGFQSHVQIAGAAAFFFAFASPGVAEPMASAADATIKSVAYPIVFNVMSFPQVTIDANILEGVIRQRQQLCGRRAAT
jgi:hypothetical protein